MAAHIQFPRDQKNYEGMQALLETSRNGFSKPLSNNCHVESHGEDVRVMLYHTPIITYTRDGKCILATRGRNTPTTRRYMQGYAPVYVFSKDYEMFITVGNETVSFYDGLVIDLETMTIVK